MSVLTVAGAARYDLRDEVLDLLRVVDMLRPAAVLGQSFGGLVQPFATLELTHVNHSCFTTLPMGGVLTGPVLLATTAGLHRARAFDGLLGLFPQRVGRLLGRRGPHVRARGVLAVTPRSGCDDRP